MPQLCSQDKHSTAGSNALQSTFLAALGALTILGPPKAPNFKRRHPHTVAKRTWSSSLVSSACSPHTALQSLTGHLETNYSYSSHKNMGSCPQADFQQHIESANGVLLWPQFCDDCKRLLDIYDFMSCRNIVLLVYMLVLLGFAQWLAAKPILRFPGGDILL